MHFPPKAQQKRLSKAQFLHLAKEAEVEASKRRWSVISERYLHQGSRPSIDSIVGCFRQLSWQRLTASPESSLGLC